MQRFAGLFLIVLLSLVGCGPTGQPIVEVGPDGVKSHRSNKTYTWSEIKSLSLSNHLNAKTNKSYPVLRIATESSPNVEIASSYSERVDSKAYAGMYIQYSIPSADLDALKETVIKSAGLTVHPESETVWVKRKDAKVEPPADSKVYFKSIGS